MNDFAPKAANFTAAFIIAAGLLCALIVSLFAMNRWPLRRTPRSVRLTNFALLLAPILCLAAGFYFHVHLNAWTFVFSPSLWPKAPEAAAFMLLGVPLAAWSLALVLKHQANIAFSVFAVVIVGFTLSSASINHVTRALKPTYQEFFTLEVISPVQARPVPSTRLILNGKNAGPAPVNITPETIAGFIDPSFALVPQVPPITTAPILLSRQDTGPLTPYRSIGRNGITGHAQVVYTHQPAWLMNSADANGADSFTRPTLCLDKAECARQHLPVFAWSILHPSASSQPPAWWARASANPGLLWEALLPAAENHPFIADLKTRLIQDQFNSGQPITSANALDVLNRAAQAAVANRIASSESLEFSAAVAAGNLLAPDQLAAWYLQTPPFQNLQTSPYQPTFPAIPAQPELIAPRLAHHVLASWGLAHQQDPAALGALGDLLNVDLLLRGQFNTPLLLGGPRFDLTAQRMSDARYAYARRAWQPVASRDVVYFQYISPWAALPAEAGDLLRTRETGAFGQAINSPFPPPSDPYAHWVHQSLYNPAPPSSRLYLSTAWSNYQPSNPARWSPNRIGRNTQPDSPLLRSWRFLSVYAQSTRDANYIDAARRIVVPRAGQPIPDFIEEIGEDFDQAVMLSDSDRTEIWRNLMQAMAAAPRQFGITGYAPASLFPTGASRPNISQDLIVARLFRANASFFDTQTALYHFTRHGLPAAAPTVMVARPDADTPTLAVDLILRVPTPENLALLQTLSTDKDAALAARAKAGLQFISQLKSLPADKLPAPFSDDACTFFTLPGDPP